MPTYTIGSVPVCPALSTPTSALSDIQAFAAKVGYPIMIKAVDGGGGRGIRLVRRSQELENLLRRAVQESPSQQVFCEKAAIDGFRHIEVQIVDDGSGRAAHLWERECSIQRKYQKIVEIAPSTIVKRQLVQKVIECAVRMAEKVCLCSNLMESHSQGRTCADNPGLPSHYRSTTFR